MANADRNDFFLVDGLMITDVVIPLAKRVFLLKLTTLISTRDLPCFQLEFGGKHHILDLLTIFCDLLKRSCFDQHPLKFYLIVAVTVLTCDFSKFGKMKSLLFLTLPPLAYTLWKHCSFRLMLITVTDRGVDIASMLPMYAGI